MSLTEENKHQSTSRIGYLRSEEAIRSKVEGSHANVVDDHVRDRRGGQPSI